MNRLIYTLTLALASLTAWAQGSITGRVVEKQTTSPLEFANVVVRQAGQAKPLKTGYTDAEGRFMLQSLPLGRYTIGISLLGYKEESATYN